MMKSIELLSILAFLAIILALCKTDSSDLLLDKNDIFISEFEILGMSNFDGRLQSGYCCNGQRAKSTKPNWCMGGNTTCLPYWRVCIAELTPDMATAMSREATDNRPSVSPIYPTSTKRPSMIQNFFSRVFGGSKSNAAQNKLVKDIIGNMSPSKCRAGLWTSDVILFDTFFPIRLRKPVLIKRSASGQVIRNYASIVEIWSKNSRIDAKNRLISRQVSIYNVAIELQALSSDWFNGGKINKHGRYIGNAQSLAKRDNDLFPPTIIATSHNENDSKFSFSYRWHLKSLNKMHDEGHLGSDDISALNITSEGCPQGYHGLDCHLPICHVGCNTEHGYCEQPGQCQCRFGWTGMLCDYCLTLPGCVHGYCNRPLECRCEEGWTGVFCSIPKCKEGCHSTNGYCTIPGECKCKFGWQGENCTECSTLPGCQHGICQEPLDCNCQTGWQGTFCSTPICSAGCENGWCKKPDECRCKIGFRGENCTECMAYPGCEHGKCQENKPWTCECEPGWGGITCNERLDWCQRQPNPCQNGGTCVSVEASSGNYVCQCSLGHTGPHCEQISI